MLALGSVAWLASGLLACSGGDDTATTPIDSTEPIVTPLSVRVEDPDGLPVADAWIMMGGWSQDDWVLSAADGTATVTPRDDGLRDPYLLAAKQGWFSGGEVLDFEDLPTETFVIELRPLPEADNPDYSFQKGGDGSSPDTSECGHCHWTIGDDWAGSRHARAADSDQVWDLFTGSATSAIDEQDCADLGGWMAEGQTPGDPAATETRCHVESGVLPWLHDTCGAADQSACEHPDSVPDLERLGSCGDCHSPAVDAGVPGSINLATATGVAREGVTCDFCHKIASVTPGTAPGLDGAIHLLRPSEPSSLPNLDFEAITFGPYPDVIVPVMNGSYAPQFRDAEWCASCHEFAQPALHPDQSGLVDADRWPDGVPVFETWSEHLVSQYAGSLGCQGCHMPTLDEQSSTYDIEDEGLEPSLDQGWERESGQVRHHGFGRAGLAEPRLTLSLETDGTEIVATVTVSNTSAGHAAPTGEPMKQLFVQVSAVDGLGADVGPVGGQVVLDVGGWAATGVIGTDVSLEGASLTFAEAVDATALQVRFVRPTGAWVDYAGPGTAGFSGEGLTAEDKGLAGEAFLASLAVASIEGESVVLAEEPTGIADGDRVYLVREGDLAGAPGWLYAKVLVSSDGERGVAHYRAVDVASDNRIASGGQGISTHRFPAQADGGELVVTATLHRRMRAAPVADAHGWDRGDSEVARTSVSSAE